MTRDEKDSLLSELGGSTGGSEKPKKGRKEKKERDPNRPKKATTPYLFYTQDRRATLKAEQPELGPRDIVRRMGAEWNELDAATKEPYDEKGARAKVRYTAAMAEYNASQ